MIESIRRYLLVFQIEVDDQVDLTFEGVNPNTTEKGDPNLSDHGLTVS